jgi:hypothetical protein
MKTTISILALELAIGVAMAQQAPPPPAEQKAAPPAATGKAPMEMKTLTYKGTLVDLSCAGPTAGNAAGEAPNANRAAGECKVTPASTQLGLRLEDGHTVRFDMVGTERAREELKTNKRWSKDLAEGKPIHATVAGAMSGNKLIVSSIH